MFSRILIKLVDQAIVPAILLIAVRIISVVGFAKYFNLSVTLGPAGFVVSETPGSLVTSPANFVLINSYSTLAMVVVIAVVLLYILAKSFLFHDTHISPGLTAKLFSLKLSSFIQNSFELYSQGTVWVSYLFLITIVSGIMWMFGLIFAWIFFTALILSLSSTVMFIFDIENEMSYNRKFEDPNENTEEVIVRF